MRKLVLLTLLVTRVAAAERYAYVTNEGDETVSVIDVDTATVAATLPIAAPRGLAVAHDGHAVYVSSWGQNSTIGYDVLNVIDVPSHALSQVTLPISYPWGVAIDPTGDYVYVSHTYSPYLSKVSTLTLGNGPIDTIDAPGSGNAYIAVDSAGDRLYWVTLDPSLGGGDVHWSDIDGNNQGVRTGAAVWPGGIAPFGAHHILLTRQNTDGSRSLISLDTSSATGLILGLTSTGAPTGVASRTIFGFPQIDLTRRSSNTGEEMFGATWSTGAEPVAIAFSDDESDTTSREAFITANHGDGTATIRYADGTSATVTVGSRPSAVAAGPVLRPRLQFVPRNLSFTFTRFNEIKLLRLKITNGGLGSLRFESLKIGGGADARAFTIYKNACPTKLAARASCNVDVQFVSLPKDSKIPSYAATLTILTNDSTSDAVVPLIAKQATGKLGL